MAKSNLIGVQISPSSGTPIYRQLIAQIQRLVTSSRLTPGTQLPSVRVLAEQLAINPMTVSKAYSALELMAILDRERGIGMVVADHQKKQSSLKQRLEQLESSIQTLLMEAKQLDISNEEFLTYLTKIMNK